METGMFKITTVSTAFKGILIAAVILAVMIFAWDIYLYQTTDQTPDFGDQVFKIINVLAPISTFVLGDILGRKS
jgi:hypothetical protein